MSSCKRIHQHLAHNRSHSLLAVQRNQKSPTRKIPPHLDATTDPSIKKKAPQGEPGELSVKTAFSEPCQLFGEASSKGCNACETR